MTSKDSKQRSNESTPRLTTSQCTVITQMLFGAKDDVELAVALLMENELKIKSRKWSKIRAGLRKARSMYPYGTQERYDMQAKVQAAFDNINRNNQLHEHGKG